MNYISNAFSLQMLPELDMIASIVQVKPEDVPADVVSAIGHADTAAVVSNILGREIPMNRVSVSLEPGDVLYVAQLQGGRLPEGVTTLPEGFSLRFVQVKVTPMSYPGHECPPYCPMAGIF